jgi:Glycosyl hydrolase family 52
VHIPRPISVKMFLFYTLLCLVVLLPNLLANRSVEAAPDPGSPPGLLQLDSRLPIQTFEANSDATNINATFGSRFDFDIQPGQNQVYSGTEGVFHDTPASYIVGVVPQGQSGAEMFHMGALNAQLSDSYLLQERWQQALDTTRWMGDTNPQAGLHITLDIINAFQGAPGCTELSDCASSVEADIAPTLYIGIQLQNFSVQTQQGNFLFGSNRPMVQSAACGTFSTVAGTAVNSLSYASSADASQGTLFLAGDQQHWSCQTQQADRAGLSWAYTLAAGKSETAYMLLGGWNSNPGLLVNTHLTNGCQNEALYYTKFWSTKEALIGYALDTLVTQQLGRAQDLEQLLLNNNSLPPEQRWLIGNTLRSYKASSWFTARADCAGGGYDAAVYEGSYGFLSTVDVMYEYGYFEIMRVPWFFKAAMEMVFINATRDQQGFYFQHDQGAEVDSQGNCTNPGHGTPTFRSTCYIPPYVTSGTPMPTEENNNVALLSAYYVSMTGDIGFVQEHIQRLQEAMQHNLNVGDPKTGIAANGQDTATTFDAANDCLHNNADNAGNLYYQGLKEASAYLATDYLASLLPTQGQISLTDWQAAADKIEQSMISAYKLHGYLPVADNSAYSNCDGRTIMQGDGLFYLQISGLEQLMNPTILRELALQYPADVKAATFQGPTAPTYVVGNPPLYLLESKRAVGTQQQCANYHCLRYTWFSKVMLSSIVADIVYSQYGCNSCVRMDLDQAAYAYNIDFPRSFGDGAREYVGYWEGFIYPRGVISWFYLDRRY